MWGESSPSSTWASSIPSPSTSSARRRSSTRRTRGSAREDPGMRETSADDGRQDRPLGGRASDRDEASRLHDQPPRGVRRRGSGPAHRGARRRVGRPYARPAGGRGAAPRRDGARRRSCDPPRDRRRGVGPAGDRRRDRGGDPRRRGGERAASTSCSSATSRPTRATTRSGSAWRTRSAGRLRQG